MNDIILTLPDGTRLRAIGNHHGEYPSIQVFLDKGERSELICFAEYNPEKEPPQVCVGAYQSHQEDTTYYEPYQIGELDYE